MDIVLTGAAGRLGAAVAAELSLQGHRVIPLSRFELDICDPLQVTTEMRRLRPGAIVNCAAYNLVDEAETEAAAAFAINATGPALLARAARELDALLVHFSTDFVFDGTATAPYREQDEPNPLSTYAATKLAGEHEARTASRYCILRVASLFGGRGIHGHRSTIDHIIDGLEHGRPVRALVDRTVTPSYVPDVARATAALMKAELPSATYHCVNTGVTTWFELALQVAALLGCPATVEAATAADLPGAARRPRYCALSNGRLAAAGIEMPGWRSAIQRHITDGVRRGAAPQLVEVC
jgi:dTDP-4-dehydrorhamnose reductase